MGEILSIIVVFLYSFSAILIFLYSFSQWMLFVSYLKKKEKVPQDYFSEKDLPIVTIQLPIFNEKYVAERLLECVSQIQYPKLEIQVLDDSTDESLASNREFVEKLALQGIDIKLIHRTDRKNFKAGALKNGLVTAKGEFIAIFDADFLPEKDWLNETIHFFTKPEIGVVQTRWFHLNRNYNLLSKIQGMALDHHFTIEQVGRNQAQHFINFNGTAGIWRKACIIDAGNWEGDTLTEDLDLSYRAQMRNWEFVYLENIPSPSELPVVMSAVRSQQFRWNKGGAENFRKFGSKVLKSKTILLNHKIHGISHLLNSSVFLWVFILSLLSVPLLFVYKTPVDFLLNAGSLLKYTSVILAIVFYTTFRKTQGKTFSDFPKFVFQFLLFFPVILGLSFHNSVAVLEGYFGKKSAFIRTPKFNITQNNDSWKNNQYLSKNLGWGFFVECFLFLYFVGGIVLGILLQNFAIIPFHFLLALGYFIIIIYTLNE
ncbi:glycosyltransferase [Lacihabitans sp. LS3-19]|nr:glycosyltransferase [Lacihabitans sp. LS3-19]